MTKKDYAIIAFIAIVSVLAGFALRGYTQTYSTTESEHEWHGGYGGRYAHSDSEDITGEEWTEDYIAKLPKQDLSQEEKDGLLWMREEEKLARDVYIKLYDKWGIRVFDNISRSEQHHMDMVKDLIDRYGLEDPVKDDTVGKFTNPKLQELYDKLIAQGYKSEVDALKVGATIEDVDIKDLNEWSAKTDNDDIKFVYSNLKHGSENHMRAFVRMLESYNATYSPQFISEEEYKAIIR